MTTSLEIEKTSLDGVLLIKPPSRFKDFRGEYVETYNKEMYEAAGIKVDFIQDDISISQKDVIRGIHGDYKTTKLGTVINGSGYIILADNRPDSATYKKWQSFTLSAVNMNQLLIPAGVGFSILALESDTIYYYKQNSHFEYGKQFTIRWNDPEWNFWWPVKNPILSRRDEFGDYQ